jgi:hypothetical protein
MRSEDILFELKPCHECHHNCVEGQPGIKCPYDKMAEDLIYAEELAFIQSQEQEREEEQ